MFLSVYLWTCRDFFWEMNVCMYMYVRMSLSVSIPPSPPPCLLLLLVFSHRVSTVSGHVYRNGIWKTMCDMFCQHTHRHHQCLTYMKQRKRKIREWDMFSLQENYNHNNNNTTFLLPPTTQHTPWTSPLYACLCVCVCACACLIVCVWCIHVFKKMYSSRLSCLTFLQLWN